MENVVNMKFSSKEFLMVTLVLSFVFLFTFLSPISHANDSCNVCTSWTCCTYYISQSGGTCMPGYNSYCSGRSCVSGGWSNCVSKECWIYCARTSTQTCPDDKPYCLSGSSIDCNNNVHNYGTCVECIDNSYCPGTDSKCYCDIGSGTCKACGANQKCENHECCGIDDYSCSSNSDCCSGYECREKECQPIEIECSDTDATDAHPDGNNTAIKGTCTDANGEHTDYCSDYYNLVEYYCSGGSCVSTTHNCYKFHWSSGNNCYYDYRCSNGRCTHSTDSNKPSCSHKISGNTCYYDGSAVCGGTGWDCSYAHSDSNKPPSYYYNSTNDHCYYSCSVSCTDSGWTRSGCIDDGSKPCDAAVCTENGWDASQCIPQYGVRVFVTSSSWNGNLGGLSGAGAKCQQAADAAGLGGTWVAWLSDSTYDAKDRIPDTNVEH